MNEEEENSRENLSNLTDEIAILNFLREKEISPFKQELVEKYKRKKVGTIIDLSPFICALSLVVLICSIVCASVSRISGSSYWTMYFVSLLITSAFSVVLSMIAFEKMLVWVTNSLKDYKNPIPEFALQTALDIKERFPKAEFFVQSLEKTTDPFLLLSLNGKRYYIEVWNEPKFKQEREQ